MKKILILIFFLVVYKAEDERTGFNLIEPPPKGDPFKDEQFQKFTKDTIVNINDEMIDEQIRNFQFNLILFHRMYFFIYF